MMIQFTGEGSDGEEIIYDSWRALAEVMSFCPLDPAFLSPDQTEFLIAEFHEALAGIEKESDKPLKDGNISVPVGQTLVPAKKRNEPTSEERHIQFATINLSILEQSYTDSLPKCTAFALEFIRSEIGDFERFDRALVEHVGRDGWRVVTLPSAGQGGVSCDPDCATCAHWALRSRTRPSGTPCDFWFMPPARA